MLTIRMATDTTRIRPLTIQSQGMAWHAPYGPRVRICNGLSTIISKYSATSIPTTGKAG